MNTCKDKIILIVVLTFLVLIVIGLIFDWGKFNKVKQPRVYSEGNKVLIANWGKHLGEVYFQKNAGGTWVGPKDYTIDQEGNIYILESNPDIVDLTRIQKFDQDGKFVLSFILDSQITGPMPTDRAAFGGEPAYIRVFYDAIYLIVKNVDRNLRVIKYSTQGKYLKTLVYKHRELDADVYISPFFFNPEGNLYFNVREKQTGNGERIYKQIKITPDDKVIEKIYDEEKEERLVGIDSKGNIYRSIPNQHRIIVYSKDKEKIKEIDLRPLSLYGENVLLHHKFFRMDFNGDIYLALLKQSRLRDKEEGVYIDNIEIIKFNQNLDRTGYLLIPAGDDPLYPIYPQIVIYPSISSDMDIVFLIVRYNIDKKQVYIEKYNL